MVARIVTGKSIKGAVNYNENKIAKGKAELIFAERYLKAAGELSFSERLGRLEDLAKRNERTKTNCVHISLNFEPKETLSDEKLVLIAKEYMEKIDLGTQPFLVYRHFDAAHAHVHIVTTNIKNDGSRISLHNIGQDKSEPIRRAIEKKYGLVQAEGRGREQMQFLKPVDLEAIEYGKSATKSAVSGIVRTIVRSYKFTSVEELNAILKAYNVIAYRGEPGSKMHDNKGLVYSILNKEGEKTGVPIKASSIYTSPTIQNLEERFAKNKESRKSYKEPLRKAIDKVIADPAIKDRPGFADALKAQNIEVIFRENTERVYGITFIDHRSLTVFNGSDIGKPYGATALLSRLDADQNQAEREHNENKKFAQQVFASVDYKQGAASIIAQAYNKDLRITTGESESGTRFFAGEKQNTSENYAPLSNKMEAYFKINGVSPGVIDRLNDYIFHREQAGRPVIFLSPSFLSMLQTLLRQQQIDYAYAAHPTRRRKRKR